MATSEILKIALAYIDKQDHIKYLHPETDSDMVNIPSDIVGGCGNRNLEDFLKTIRTAALKNAVTGKEGDNDSVPTVSRVGEMIDSGAQTIIDNILESSIRDKYNLPFMFRNSYQMTFTDESNCSLNTLPCGFLIGDSKYLDYVITPIKNIACIKSYQHHVYHFEFEADIDSLAKSSKYPTQYEEIGLFVGKFDTPSKSCNVLQNNNTCKWIAADQAVFASYNIDVYDENNSIVYTEEKNVGLTNKINFVTIMKSGLTQKGGTLGSLTRMKLAGTFTVNSYTSTTAYVGLYFNSDRINAGSESKNPHPISDTVKNWKFTIS